MKKYIIIENGVIASVCLSVANPGDGWQEIPLASTAESGDLVTSYDAEWERIITLPEVQADLIAKIEARKDPLMKQGFIYNNVRVTADAEAQANLTAWVVRDGRGGLTYPKNWILPDGGLLTLATTADLDALTEAFESFKEGIYTRIVQAETAISAATTIQEAQAAFDQGGLE